MKPGRRHLCILLRLHYSFKCRALDRLALLLPIDAISTLRRCLSAQSMPGTGKSTAGASWPLLLISFSVLQMSLTGISQSTPTLRFEVSVWERYGRVNVANCHAKYHSHLSISFFYRIIPCTYNCTCPLGTSGSLSVVRSNASALAGKSLAGLAS